MRKSRPLKPLLLLFAAALVFYFSSYFTIEHVRARRGPWQVTFSSENSQPQIRIDQPALGITNVQIAFSGMSDSNVRPETLQFGRPKPVPFDVPFGQCIFMDTTFQPGTVVLRIGGYDIQMLPRSLTIGTALGTNVYRWASDTTLRLEEPPIPTNGPAPRASISTSTTKSGSPSAATQLPFNPGKTRI